MITTLIVVLGYLSIYLALRSYYGKMLLRFGDVIYEED